MANQILQALTGIGSVIAAFTNQARITDIQVVHPYYTSSAPDALAADFKRVGAQISQAQQEVRKLKQAEFAFAHQDHDS